MKIGLLIALLLAALPAQAQSYSISWYRIAGGGYSLTSGFWSLISVVQSPGMPMLAISRAGNSVVVSWPDTGSYVLQQNSSLGASGWSNSNYAISTNNGASSVTLTPPPGNLFFRLSQ
jgi:hypothetical protein